MPGIARPAVITLSLAAPPPAPPAPAQPFNPPTPISPVHPPEPQVDPEEGKFPAREALHKKGQLNFTFNNIKGFAR